MATTRSYRRDRNKKTSAKRKLPKDPGTPKLGARGRSGFQSKAGRSGSSPPKRRQSKGAASSPSYDATVSHGFDQRFQDAMRGKRAKRNK